MLPTLKLVELESSECRSPQSRKRRVLCTCSSPSCFYLLFHCTSPYLSLRRLLLFQAQLGSTEAPALLTTLLEDQLSAHNCGWHFFIIHGRRILWGCTLHLDDLLRATVLLVSFLLFMQEGPPSSGLASIPIDPKASTSAHHNGSLGMKVLLAGASNQTAALFTNAFDLYVLYSGAVLPAVKQCTT